VTNEQERIFASEIAKPIEESLSSFAMGYILIWCQYEFAMIIVDCRDAPVKLQQNCVAVPKPRLVSLAVATKRDGELNAVRSLIISLLNHKIVIRSGNGSPSELWDELVKIGGPEILKQVFYETLHSNQIALGNGEIGHLPKGSVRKFMAQKLIGDYLGELSTIRNRLTIGMYGSLGRTRAEK
jgi:hypothetical protein